MAGRGVDIALGGRDPETDEIIPEQYELVKQLGGLHVIGSERHESRRIDNQLRGRSGRQGDPGSSRFYVSLEDDLMKLFGPERVGALIGGWPEEEPVAARLVSKTLERAQMKVEMRHMGMRKNTLKYDDVMNTQRSVVYQQRRRVLDGENVHSSIERMIRTTVQNVLEMFAPENQPSEEWDLETLYQRVRRVVGTPPEADAEADVEIAATGVSMRLAELYLTRLAEEGEDIAARLREVAEPHAELNRSMDRKRAQQMARDTVRNDIDAVMARFSDSDGTVSTSRLIDVARAVGELYDGALEDLGLSGVYTIDWRELHDVIPALASTTSPTSRSRASSGICPPSKGGSSASYMTCDHGWLSSGYGLLWLTVRASSGLWRGPSLRTRKSRGCRKRRSTKKSASSSRRADNSKMPRRRKKNP